MPSVSGPARSRSRRSRSRPASLPAGGGRIPGICPPGRCSALITEEVEAGTYEPPVEPAILGYAIVKLAQAFLFNDTIAGIRGDVDRLREVEAALLGVPA